MRVVIQCGYCNQPVELDKECPCLFDQPLFPGRIVPSPGPAQIRTFATGGTRTADTGRYDPEGFLSPLVIERFCEYMQKHRIQADGRPRDSDNWQKGMPKASYMKGLLRHVLHAWSRHRGLPVRDEKAAVDLEEDLCAALFNIQGYLFELLVQRDEEKR